MPKYDPRRESLDALFNDNKFATQIANNIGRLIEEQKLFADPERLIKISYSREDGFPIYSLLQFPGERDTVWLLERAAEHARGATSIFKRMTEVCFEIEDSNVQCITFTGRVRGLLVSGGSYKTLRRNVSVVRKLPAKQMACAEVFASLDYPNYGLFTRQDGRESTIRPAQRMYRPTTYLPGDDLYTWIEKIENKEIAVRAKDFLDIMRDLLVELKYFQDRNLLHRDIALENILIYKNNSEDRWQARFIDLIDMVKLGDDGSIPVTAVDTSGHDYTLLVCSELINLKGKTFHYRPDAKFTKKLDIFALGSVFREMLACAKLSGMPVHQMTKIRELYRAMRGNCFSQESLSRGIERNRIPQLWTRDSIAGLEAIILLFNCSFQNYAIVDGDQPPPYQEPNLFQSVEFHNPCRQIDTELNLNMGGLLVPFRQQDQGFDDNRDIILSYLKCLIDIRYHEGLISARGAAFFGGKYARFPKRLRKIASIINGSDSNEQKFVDVCCAIRDALANYSSRRMPSVQTFYAYLEQVVKRIDAAAYVAPAAASSDSQTYSAS